MVGLGRSMINQTLLRKDSDLEAADQADMIGRISPLRKAAELRGNR
jgi:hypothetical protein